MNNSATFEAVVTAEREGERLDVFAAELAGVTRSRAGALIRDGYARVGGDAQTKAGFKLKQGIAVAVTVPEAAPAAAEAEDIELNILYQDDDVAVVTGMIHSFYDAPGWGYAADGSGRIVETGVFMEELSEINIGGGIEYWYNNIFALRGGYFYESPLKGSRQYVTLGAALKYNAFGLDISYLIPTNAKVVGKHPLENTLRFNLTFALGQKKS